MSVTRISWVVSFPTFFVKFCNFFFRKWICTIKNLQRRKDVWFLTLAKSLDSWFMHSFGIFLNPKFLRLQSCFSQKLLVRVCSSNPHSWSYILGNARRNRDVPSRFPAWIFLACCHFWKINTPRLSGRKLVVGLRPSCAHSKSSKVRNRWSGWKIALFVQICVLFLLHWNLFFTTINKTIFVCWHLVSALADCSRKCRFDDPVYSMKCLFCSSIVS